MSDKTSKIQAAVTAGEVLARALPVHRAFIRAVFDAETGRKQEAEHAKNLGVTVSQYRFMRRFPHLVDWSKIGKEDTAV